MLLARHALGKALSQQNRDNVTISDAAMQALMDYHWPGNVREMENALQYAVLKCKSGPIRPCHLPPALGGGSHADSASADGGRKRGPDRKLDAESVRRALEETGGNKSEAARRLGVGRATLYRFLSASDTPDLD